MGKEAFFLPWPFKYPIVARSRDETVSGIVKCRAL